MFIIDGKPMQTWSPFTGCLFGCTYCWARKLALGRLKNVPRYRGGFVPHFNSDELFKPFKSGDWVFISDMGDISFATVRMVQLILARVWSLPDVTFLVLSKNPAQFREWGRWGVRLPPNLLVGTTLETNRAHRLSKAPSPAERVEGLRGVSSNIFVSLEPLMDFDLSPFVRMLESLEPSMIQIGADNYWNHLPEPPTAKVTELVQILRQICPQVVEKPGLSRLLGISLNSE